MENFWIAFNAVVPVFCFIFIGLLVRKFKILTYEDATKLNGFVFNVFLSTSIFYGLYTAQLGDALRPKLLLFAIVAIIIVCSLCTAIICFFVKDNKTRGAMIQAIYRSNFIIMGIPLMANIFGSEKIAMANVAVSVVVPMYNVIAVIILETFRGQGFSWSKIFKGIYHNYLLRGAVLGLVLHLLNVELPKPVLGSLKDIAKAASPLALIVLGASFRAITGSAGYKKLLVCLLGKLVFVPVLVLSAAWFLGFRGMELVILIAIFGTPTAVSSYAMAQQLNSDADLTGNCVVFSTGLACITMFLWIYFFKSIGGF